MRILFLIGCLVLPTVLYLIWLKIERRRIALREQGQLQGIEALPWSWLIVAGTLLMIAMMVLLRVTGWDPDAWIGGESLVDQRDLWPEDHKRE